MVLIRDAIKSVLKYLSKTNAGDSDRRWSVHYTTHKPLHGLLFLPTTTRGSPDQNSPLQVLSLNQQNDCSSAGPAHLPSSAHLDQSDHSRGFDWRHRGRRMKSRLRDFLSQSCFSVCFKFSVWTRKSSVESDEDERLVVAGIRPLTPLVLTSCWEGQTSCIEDRTSCGVLPTPEERTRSQARAVVADIVPINVTGESFDRQAGLQRSLSNRDSLNRRPNLQRRKTITGTPQDFSRDMVCPDPVHFSTVDRPSSVHNLHKTSDPERNQTEPRRIRAPRGDLCSLMTSLTSPKGLAPQEVHRSTSCPQTETSSDWAPYRTLYYSPSDFQSEVQSVSCSSVCLSQLQDEPWSYQPLSPSCSPHSAQESGSVCGEAWNCDPLLFSSPCSPSHHSLFSDDTSCSYSLHLGNNPSHSFSQTSLYLEEITSNSSNIPDKMASQKTSHTMSPSYNSLSSEATSNFSSKLDKNLSYSQSSLCSSSSLKLDKRSSVSSGSSLCRTISLRKSKRPPAPPMRTDSLRRKPNRQKPPRLEKKKTASSSPQTFNDPWVLRSDAKRRQSGLNCGTVSTFEPLQLEPKEQEPEILPTTPNSSQVFVSCENGFQRLASPSSGYSSQSNTPTAGTPLSSPLTPSSPLTGNSEIPAFLNAPKVSSFPRTKSNGKPKPPERKSSLFSSLSSSFSSTSSLSSYTSSSDSSAKHLPPPPPLPVFNQQLPICPYQICNSNVPSSNAAHNSSNSSRTDSTRLLPPPPPLPPPLSLPCPPPLPVFNQQPPVCHLPNNKPLSKSLFLTPDSAVFSHTNSMVSMPLPPPPPLPPHLPLPTPPPLPATTKELSVSRCPLQYSQQTPPLNLNKFTLSPNIALTTASPPSPPPLPPLLSRPSPPSYSHALKQLNFPHSSLVPSSKPPLPPPLPLTASPTCSISKPSICKSHKMANPTCPLVTTQALRNVKLRSVKSQEIIRTNSMPSMETAQATDTNTSLEKLRNKPHANSFSSLSESPGRKIKLNRIKCEISKPRDGVSCPNLSQQQSFAQKAHEESNRQVSSPTSTKTNTNHVGYTITEEAHTHLITGQAKYNLPQYEKNKPKNYLACAEKSQQDKGLADSTNPVSIPPSKTGFMLTEEANTPLIATEVNYSQTEIEINKLGADLRQNERFEEVFEDTSKTETVLTSICSSKSSSHLANSNQAIPKSNQVNYNQTKCENNPRDTLSHAKLSRQPTLDKNKKVHEDSDLCGESCQPGKETDMDKVRFNSVEVCSKDVRVESNQDLQKSPKMAKPRNNLPCDHLWSQQGSDQEDLEMYAPTGNANQINQTRKESKKGKTAFMNEDDNVEMDKRLAAAEVRSKDFNIQNALITNVNQYELKTSQTYFQTCDNISNPQDFQEDCPLENFGKRHQAYLDMYAMLADSTVSRPATEEAKVDTILVENSNLGREKISTTHVRSKKTQSKVNYPHYNMMEQGISHFNDGKGHQDKHGSARLKTQESFGECPKDGRHIEKDEEGSNVYAPMEKTRVTSSDSPWVKLSYNDDNNFTIQHQEVSKTEESQYWSLSGENYKTESQKEDIAVMLNVPELNTSPANLKEDTREKCSPRNFQSPVKPVLPKKPDLGILGLLMSPKGGVKRTTSVEKITPDKAQMAATSSNSPQRQKPPISHKKPDLSTLLSPKSSPSHLPLNGTEQVWSSQTLENCGVSQIWTTRNTENDNSSTNLSTSTMENCVTSTISSNNFMENCENSSIMQKSGAPTIGTMDNADNENFYTSTVFGSALDYYDKFRMWSSTMKNNADLGNYSNNTQENCDYSASAKETAATSRIRFGNSGTSAMRSDLCSGNESRIWSTVGNNASKICNSDNYGQICSPGTGINPESLAVSVPSTMESHGHSRFWDSTVMVGTVPSRMCNNSAINNNSNSRAKDDFEKSANWTDKLENALEISSDNIWCQRNIENTTNLMEKYSTSKVINHINRENVGSTAVFGEWLKNNSGASTMPGNTEENGSATRNYIQQNATILSQIQSLQTQQSCSYRFGVISTERRMQCSLAEDEEECVTEHMGTSTIMMPNKKTRKRRKRRANKQLLMNKMEHSSLSSSSMSSESEFEKSLHMSQRLGLMKVGAGDSTDSDGSCDAIGQSRLPLSSALSTDSLKGELSLPQLQEPDQEDEQGRQEEQEKAEGNDVFVSVSADQVTVPIQTRTTDDLFAIIHRSKRKMFGRKDSENNRSSSSSSPPSTPADLPTQPKGQSSLRSNSFKALLLKKGSHFTSTSRPSAVERLCGVRPHLQKIERDELSFGWVSTSCVFVSTSCVRQRPLTPLSSASRRFAARSRFYVTPMASILENEEEEDDEDDDVFVLD